mgnify:CR=1 FL=1
MLARIVVVGHDYFIKTLVHFHPHFSHRVVIGKVDMVIPVLKYVF